MIGIELIQVAVGNRQRLSHVPSEREWEEAYDFAEKQSVMWVMKEVFGMPDVFLLCEANVVSHSTGSGQAGSSAEREGRFLLSEIMQAGNFGKYDKRIDHSGGKTKHAWEKTKHNLRLIRHYPEEVLWEPPFRLYHWCWRKLRLWRWGC